MIRILLENILLFLLPTGIYLLYALAQRRMAGGSQAPTRMLDDAPLLWLFLAGALTVVLVLAAFGSNTGGKPGVAYEPPSFQDGHIVPGHQAQPAPAREARPATMPGEAAGAPPQGSPR